MSATATELQVQCQNVECAHTWVAITSIVRTIAPSMTPKPGVLIPLSPRSPVALARDSAAANCQTLIPGLDTMPHPRAMAANDSG